MQVKRNCYLDLPYFYQANSMAREQERARTNHKLDSSRSRIPYLASAHEHKDYPLCSCGRKYLPALGCRFCASRGVQ